MSRGIGIVTALQGELPDVVVVLFALVTQLGDVWFYFLALSLLYWLGDHLPVADRALDRRHAAFLIALALGTFTLVTSLKAFFALPRPPGAGEAQLVEFLPDVLVPLYVTAATGDGYGFPSGHAVGVTMLYGGLALVLDAGTRRGRFLGAAVVVSLVAVSRVVLGVHFVVDVVAGVVLGAAYLAVAYWLTDRATHPGRAFSLALAVGLVGVLVVGYRRDPVAALGAALGARIAWGAVGGAVLDHRPTFEEGVGTTATGILAFGLPFVATYLVSPPIHVAFLVYGVVMAGVLVLPLVGDRFVRRYGEKGPM